MNGHRVSVGLILWAGTFSAMLPVCAQPTAAEKAKQRRVSGNQADALLRDGKFAEAVEPATACVRLSREIDGEKHWRTYDAEQRLKLAQTAKGFPEENQKKLREAMAAEVQAEWQNLKPPESLKLARTALDGYRELLGEETAEVARVWHLIGVIGLRTNDAKGANEANENALKIRRKALPEIHPDIGKSLGNLGIGQSYLGDNKKAGENFREAIRIWKMALGESDSSVADGLIGLANMQYSLREYDAAKQSYTEALVIRRKAYPRDHPDVASILIGLANVQWSLRELEAAKESYAEALAIRRKTYPKDHLDVAFSLAGLANVQWSLREYEAARQSYTEALVIRRKAYPRGHPDVASSLTGLGNVQWTLREYEPARQSYTEALAIHRKLRPKDHPEVARSLTSLGNVQLSLLEYEAARQSYTEALAIHRKTYPQDQIGLANSLIGLGNVQFSLREYEAAKQSHTEALAIRRKAYPRDHPEVAQSLCNLGNVERFLREYEGARQSYTEALAIFRKAHPRDHPDVANCLNCLGFAQLYLGEYEAARQSYVEALIIQRKIFPREHPDLAVSLSGIGGLQDRLREYASARQSYTEALAINRKTFPKDHPRIAQNLYNLGREELRLSGTSAQTIELLAEALAIKRADLTRLAGSQAEAEQLGGANESRYVLNLYLSAIADSPGENSAAYHQVASFKGTVTARQRWTREVRNPNDAATAELLRKLTLVDRELLGSSLPEQSRERAHGSNDPKKRLAELQFQRTELERQLSTRSEAYRVFLAKAKIGGDEIRAGLPPGTCLIDFREYVHVAPPPPGKQDPLEEKRLIAFVINPGMGKGILVPLGQSEPVARLVERWRASYGVGRLPVAGEPDPGVELRKALWEPLQKHLDKEVKTVLISPDGPLHGLPFAALPGAKAGTYLLHEYAFAIVPVPILLPEMMEKKPGRSEATSLLLMGGIDFGEGKDVPAPTGSAKLPAVPRYLNLAGTDSEVNDLRAQFEEAFPDALAPKIFKKDRATKAAFLQNAASFGYVHLATHGFFAQESEKSALDPGSAELGLRDFQMDRVLVGRNPGLLSGIVFAGVNSPDRPKEDGVLTALEAGELDLSRTELVVLSACETGRGKVAGGEGVLGLQRAFQLAGARTVVASLWKVPDEETHQLMREFYRRLWDVKKPVSRVEALRQAQLWMLTNGKRSGLQPPELKGPLPPHVWAAFVLSGDWR